MLALLIYECIFHSANSRCTYETVLWCRHLVSYWLMSFPGCEWHHRFPCHVRCSIAVLLLTSQQAEQWPFTSPACGIADTHYHNMYVDIALSPLRPSINPCNDPLTFPTHEIAEVDYYHVMSLDPHSDWSTPCDVIRPPTLIGLPHVMSLDPPPWLVYTMWCQLDSPPRCDVTICTCVTIWRSLDPVDDVLWCH